MAASFADLLLVLIWPVLFSAAVWVIAIRALSEADEISAVVQALTRSKAVPKDAAARSHIRQPKAPAIALHAETGSCSADVEAQGAKS